MMKHKPLTIDDKDKIIQRIAQGEHMAHIAKEMGRDKGGLCKRLQRHNNEAYRQAVITKMQLLEQQAVNNLMNANSNEDRKRLLRVIKHYRCALSKYEPSQFVYIPIPRQDAQVKPPYDKSRF